MHRIPALLAPITAASLLTACAAANDYPSLARRPAETGAAERPSGSAEPVAPAPLPAPPAPPSEELTPRLNQLTGQARAAHQRFTAKRGAAERTVGSAGRAATGSENWSVATVALSDLESSRSDGMIALAELDQLYNDQAIAASQSGDTTVVDAIADQRDLVIALIGEEDEVLARLRGRLGG